MEPTIETCADAIIIFRSIGGDRIVLIERLGTPKGLAMPGGRLDPGESLEQCIVREVKEETGLELEIVRQLHTYSDPKRDPRGQKVSTVFLGIGSGEFHNGEPGKTELVFIEVDKSWLKTNKDRFAFDHYQILDENWGEILKIANKLGNWLDLEPEEDV